MEMDGQTLKKEDMESMVNFSVSGFLSQSKIREMEIALSFDTLRDKAHLTFVLQAAVQLFLNVLTSHQNKQWSLLY